MILAVSGKCFIGLTQWQHSEWHDQFLTQTGTHALQAYSRYFSSVEGNSTFYGLPKHDSVLQWSKLTPEHFRFCFKFPQQISHSEQLRFSKEQTAIFLDCVSPLEERLGLLCLQLPGSFSAEQLPQLQAYLANLPNGFNYAVEVRHLDFFDKADNEKRFNQLLAEHNINRISFDTRGLFADPASDPISLKAKDHKPQVPVHALATGSAPMIRFITSLNWQWGCQFLTPWLKKAVQWLDEGRTPYFFFHTPDNAEAPLLANYFVEELEKLRPGCCLFQAWPPPETQTTLF